jgi:dihydrofolate reductase
LKYKVQRMPLSLIVAYAGPERVIGKEGGIPWKLSSDLKRFKRLTMGHHLIMGRKTFESLARPLPGRTSIVLSRQPDLQLPPGVLHASTMEAALALCGDDPEPFVIGGAEVYQLALPWVTKCYETVVHLETPISGDALYPEAYLAQRSEWRCTTRESHSAQEKDECDYEYQVWEKLVG